MLALALETVGVTLAKTVIGKTGGGAMFEVNVPGTSKSLP